MDISIYNTSLALCGVVDEISSLIWHRRFFKAGYFKLTAPATPNNTKLLIKHNIIEKNDSIETGFITSVVLTNDDNGEIEIIIAKQRNGPTGTVKLHFMKQYNKFTDIDYAHADMS